MSTSKGLLHNLGAGVWSRVSIVIFRLVQVPLLLAALGVDDLGRWLVVSSLPSWLSLANMGFGSVASNEMSMSVSNNDTSKANQVFSTTLAMISAIAITGSIIVFSVSFFVPWERFLKAAPGRHWEFSWTMIFLALSVFVAFSFEVFAGRFRAARASHRAVILSSFFPWMSLLGIVVCIQFTKRFDYLALSQLIAALVFLFLYQFLSRRVMPSVKFAYQSVSFKKFGYLLKKGFAFQAFPLGNALIFQGSIVIVQTILGPAAVTVFGTVRTLVRSVNQAMEMINQAIWPEMSHLFGGKDYRKAARLHQVGVAMSLLLSLFGLLFLCFFGKYLYGLWIGKSVVLSEELLLLFLLPIPFNALWLTSSVVHMASNQHEGLAARYLMATVLSAMGCVLLSYFFGIAGAAVSTALADIVLIPFVIKNSILLTHDTPQGFYRGVYNSVRELPVLSGKLAKKLRRN